MGEQSGTEADRLIDRTGQLWLECDPHFRYFIVVGPPIMEDIGIVSHNTIRTDPKGTIQVNYRIFERLSAPWETDWEMKRVL